MRSLALKIWTNWTKRIPPCPLPTYKFAPGNA